MADPVFSEVQLERLTGYHRPAEQLAELHNRGFHRAYRNRLGQVVLEWPHYDAVCAGQAQQAQPARPKVRLLRTA